MNGKELQEYLASGDCTDSISEETDFYSIPHVSFKIRLSQNLEIFFLWEQFCNAVFKTKKKWILQDFTSAIFGRYAFSKKCVYSWALLITEKNGFVTATKLGTTNYCFVAATKNIAAATKRFVDRAKHFVVVTKYFCYPYFNKWFCWYNKTFFFSWVHIRFPLPY